MYGNIRLAFLVCYKEKLNISYRRFVEICSENSVQRMLCIKRIPHFTTLQKFVQRTPKALFEALVRACRKLLNLKDVEASIDGTGFSNTNPSHYYMRRSIEQDRRIEVKNYTKTLFLADNKTKLILNVKTFSDNTSEMTQLKTMVSEIARTLKTLIADKGYDSASNRKHCLAHGIKPVIPARQYARTRAQNREPSKRYKQQLDKQTYNRRALIESVNSAIKRTLGSYVCSRRADNQQKTVTLKAIAYNIEHIGRTIKIWLFINRQGFLHRR
jgi:transposase